LRKVESIRRQPKNGREEKRDVRKSAVRYPDNKVAVYAKRWHSWGPKHHLHSGFKVCGYVILAIEALQDVYRSFSPMF
jgi:hypothetical protein